MKYLYFVRLTVLFSCILLLTLPKEVIENAFLNKLTYLTSTFFSNYTL